MLEIIKQGEGLYDPDSIEKSDSKLCLIDADSLLYYCMGEETFEDCKIKLDNFILNILETCKTHRYVAFMTPYETFRRKVGVTKPYKGNRKGKKIPPVFYGLKAYAEQEWDFTSVKGIEADDCVGIYGSMLKDQEVVICSPDKDVILQVPGLHYNYQKNEWVNNNVESAWHFLWMQVLAGDSVDGVPGIPGIGMKKAEAAFEGVPKEKFPVRALDMYLEKIKVEDDSKFDQSAVKLKVDKFKETLDLVYMLKTEKDLSSYGIELPELQINNVLEKWEEETQSSL